MREQIKDQLKLAIIMLSLAGALTASYTFGYNRGLTNGYNKSSNYKAGLEDGFTTAADTIRKMMLARTPQKPIKFILVEKPKDTTYFVMTGKNLMTLWNADKFQQRNDRK